MPLANFPDYPPCFSRLLKDILKKFPKSESSVLGLLATLSRNPMQGDRMPGFAPMHLRKLRAGLPEYRIGKSGGLRVIYMLHESRPEPLFVTVYYKGDYSSEHDVVALVKSNLRAILASI